MELLVPRFLASLEAFSNGAARRGNLPVCVPLTPRVLGYARVRKLPLENLRISGLITRHSPGVRARNYPGTIRMLGSTKL